MYKLGLIGSPLTHSFSKKYFDKKFEKEKITSFSYDLFPLEDLNKINKVLKEEVIGLNITQPYKKKIINLLDELDPLAEEVQSVNTIFINPKTKKKIGYNTDVIGFKKLLTDVKNKKTALILGSGGVSSTIAYVLRQYNITHTIVSRNPKNDMISYNNLDQNIQGFDLIINTTPLGQHPNINTQPDLPYEFISQNHQCIDLIYNPDQSMFLQTSKSQGAKTKNGKKMFITQAEASFDIWRKMISEI
ncbi:MAG: shikimate dehydrogenase [Flavobacteriales bacterium]|nr:shikimate dehydrogenase [Flavobacteriales bacterium]